jgi:predicted protein tyrosine phosphatase
MNYNRIDVLDRGIVWQGGSPDAAIDQPPFSDPILIIVMDRGAANDQWINHKNVEAVLAVWIDDIPTGCLKDNVLIGLVDAAAAWLNDGGNLYIHCAMGVSRSSYFDVALHMRIMHCSYDTALAKIREARSIANPNPGFEAQLRRMEKQQTS